MRRLEQSLTLIGGSAIVAGEWFALSEIVYTLTMLGRWEEGLGRFAELPGEELGRKATSLGRAG